MDIRAASVVTARSEQGAWVISIAWSTVKAKINWMLPSKGVKQMNTQRTYTQNGSLQATSCFQHCWPLLLPKSQDRTTVKEQCAWPSVPFVDLSPTQQCFHISFIFLFSWPIELTASALKFFVHVRMEIIHTKQTNLKEIFTVCWWEVD